MEVGQEWADRESSNPTVWYADRTHQGKGADQQIGPKGTEHDGKIDEAV